MLTLGIARLIVRFIARPISELLTAKQSKSTGMCYDSRRSKLVASSKTPH